MKRRTFQALLGAGLLPVVCPGYAQRVAKVWRIGWLGLAGQTSSLVREVLGAFWEGMKERGLVEGRDVVVEYRFAEGSLSRLPELAIELVGLNVDLIVAASMAGVHACRQATKTIPIVCFTLDDPVEENLAVSLARPGGNVTGLAIFATELASKQLNLLLTAVPNASRIAALWQPGALSEPRTGEMLKSIQSVAHASGVDLRIYGARTVQDLEGSLAAIGKDLPDALLLMASPLSVRERQRIGEFIVAQRLPTMGWIREFVQVGALMSYGVDFNDQYRRGASYVVRILKGAHPGTLPIEQPTKFQFAIDLKTARSLGVSVPTLLLVQADEVIE
jgi:putative tryptophan/tyrosine transport system substrate-binding protein